MGCSIRNHSGDFLNLDRIMIIINLLLFIIGVALYIINRILLNGDYYGVFKWLMLGYFNDFVGSISFISYCNLVSMFFLHKMYFVRLRNILLLLFTCGMFWEMITPLYRKGSVCDPWDIVAYLSGGIMNFLIYQVIEKRVIKQ